MEDKTRPVTTVAPLLGAGAVGPLFCGVTWAGLQAPSANSKIREHHKYLDFFIPAPFGGLACSQARDKVFFHLLQRQGSSKPPPAEFFLLFRNINP
jgi:hypothetical protein